MSIRLFIFVIICKHNTDRKKSHQILFCVFTNPCGSHLATSNKSMHVLNEKAVKNKKKTVIMSMKLFFAKALQYLHSSG